MINDKYSDEELNDLSDFFKVFAEASRLKILFLLEEGECCVNCIAEQCGMSQSAVSQQLKILRASRLVRYRKDGRNINYRLSDDHISRILRLGREHYEELQNL